MNIKVITRNGKQEIEATGRPIILCVEDKKYILTEKGTFRRIRTKLKKELVEIMEEWK